MSLPNISYTVDENKIYYNPLVETIVEYTTTDGLPIPIKSQYKSIFSSTYENGVGQWKWLDTGGTKYFTFSAVDEDECSKRLTSVKFPEGLKRIGGGSYYIDFFKSLQSIDFPSTLEYIGERCFLGFPSSMNLVIPKSVKTILKEAFVIFHNSNHYVIKSLTLEGNDFSGFDKQWIMNYTLNNFSCQNLTLSSNTFIPFDSLPFSNFRIENADEFKLYVPSPLLDTYKTADGWSDYSNVDNDCIHSIPE